MKKWRGLWGKLNGELELFLESVCLFEERVPRPLGRSYSPQANKRPRLNSHLILGEKEGESNYFKSGGSSLEREAKSLLNNSKEDRMIPRIDFAETKSS